MRLRDYTNVERRRYIQRQPEKQSLEGLEVLLHLDSFCLGDTICWGSLVPKFFEHHKPKKLTITTFWPELFGHSDKFEFMDAVGSSTIICDKILTAGYDKHSVEHTTHGMPYAAKVSLKIPQDSAHDRTVFKPYTADRQPNKVVIAPESTKVISRWDYKGADMYGWQELVDKLVARGLDVHDISYEQILCLRNTQKHKQNDDISVVLRHICESRLFIGLSSGLAWLAWAYQIPVVMIAGFTKHFNEFPCYRVTNEYACNGCFNVFPDIKSSCPLFKDTAREHECHRTITPDMVMAQVEKALADQPWFCPTAARM